MVNKYYCKYYERIIKKKKKEENTYNILELSKLINSFFNLS